MPNYTIRIVIDPSGAQQGGKAVEGSLNRVGDTATRIRNLLAQTFAFAGVAAAVRSSVNTMRSFSQEISTVAGVTGATGKEFQALSDRARELGATTRFTATQAAESLVGLARAGFTVGESLDTVDDVLQLAQSGATDLATATGITTSALRGFRLATDQAARVTDVLTDAANASNTNVTQLGEGLKFVAPIAAGLGVTLEEAVASMGALSDAGLQSTLAGTGLRRVLSELESPTKKSEQILAQLGLTADEVRVSQVGLATAVLRLRDAGIDTGQALEFFGDRGGPAFEVLSKQIPRVNELRERLENSGGTARRVARIMDDNLNGAFFALQSAAEAVVLALGEFGAQEGLTRFIRNLAEFLRVVAKNIDDVVAGSQVLVAGLIAIKVQSLLAAAGLTSFGGAAAFAEKQMLRLNLAIARNPIGAALIVLTTVITALVLFRDQIRLGEGRLASLGDLAKVIFGTIQRLVQPLVENFRRGVLAIEEIFGIATGSIKLDFVSVARAILQTLDTIIGGFEGWGRILVETVRGTFDLLRRTVRGEAGPLSGEFARLNAQIAAAGAAGFDQSRVTDAFEAAVAGAERLARERAREAGTDISAGGVPAALPTDIEPPPDPGAEAAERAAALQGVIAQLEREGELLRLNTREREVQADLDQLVASLAEDKVDVTPEERQRLQLLLEQNQALADQAQIREEGEKTVARLARENELLQLGNRERELQVALDSALSALAEDISTVPLADRATIELMLEENRALSEQAQILEEIKGPQEELAARMENLQALLNAGRISAEEFRLELEKIRIAQLDLARDVESGATRALLKLQMQLEDVATRVEQSVTTVFQGLQDTLVSFFSTGEANVRQFVTSILAELSRLALDPLFARLAAALAGGGGGGGTAGALGDFGSSGVVFAQHGANLRAGQPAFVGERGPEPFVPAVPGTVVPNAASATPVNLTVVNVRDEDEVNSTLSSGRADQAVLNVLSRNSRAVRGALGLGTS